MNTFENADFMFEPVDNRPDWLDELAEQVYQDTKSQVDSIIKFYDPNNFAYAFNAPYEVDVTRELKGRKTLTVNAAIIDQQAVSVLDQKRGFDFYIRLTHVDGGVEKFIVLGMNFHPKCDVNFRNKKLDLTYYGKVLTSLVWHASEGAIPGFYFWKDVQGELCERDYLEHEGKEEERVFRNVHSVLD